MNALGPGEIPAVRLSYPHMLVEDSDTWRTYLSLHPDQFERVWYDVHCGTPVEVPEGSPEFMKAVALGVTRKRIDVVARAPEAFYVIEIKPVCSTYALGQAIAYRDLLSKEMKFDRTLIGAICCDELDVDIYPIAVRMGIRVFCNRA